MIKHEQTCVCQGK